MFSQQFLPSSKDIPNHARAAILRIEQRSKSGLLKYEVQIANKETEEDVIQVWKKGPYPHILNKGIEKKIEKLQHKNKALIKSRKNPWKGLRVKEMEAKAKYN